MALDPHVEMDDIHGGQAVWIGACQILVGGFPGLTLHVDDCGGQLAGMSRGPHWSFRSFFPSER